MSFRSGRSNEVARASSAVASPQRSRTRKPPSYARLMQVTITNTYYRQSSSDAAAGSSIEELPQDVCTDFSVVPTPPTRALLHKLRLLLRQQAAGFTIGYDSGNTAALVDYLRRQAKLRRLRLESSSVRSICKNGPSSDPYWTRLSFELQCNNSEFVNFTEFPVDRPPSSFNFYLSNQTASSAPIAEGSTAIQDRPELATWHFNPTTYLPVVPAKFTAPVPLGVNEVQVQDISGVPVLTASRWKMGPRSVPVADNQIFLDFSSLPEDMYTICWKGGQLKVLYTTSTPKLLGFIDLLFSVPSGIDAFAHSPQSVATKRSEDLDDPPSSPAPNPVEDSTSGSDQRPGVYPLKNLAEPTVRIQPVSYRLEFRNRWTHWIYYVIQQGREKFTDLKIRKIQDKASPKEPRPVEFHHLRQLVAFENGTLATCFVSHEKLPLHLYIHPWLQLYGRRGDGPEQILLKRMPVPSPQQLFPDPKLAITEGLAELGIDLGETIYSEEFVYI